LLKAFLKGFLKAVTDRPSEHFYKFGDFCLDLNRRLLLRDGDPVPLTPKAFDTLLILVSRSGRVVAKGELLKEVWPDTFVEEATLAQNVFTLRKALGQNGPGQRYIQTVPKHGYRFVADVSELRSEGAADAPVEMHTPTGAHTTEATDAQAVDVVEEAQRVPLSGPKIEQGKNGQAVFQDQQSAPRPEGADNDATLRRSFSNILRRVGRHRRALLAAAIFLATTVAVAAIFFLLNSRRESSFQRMRISRLTTNGKALSTAISPDGKYVVNVFKDGAQESLWLRQVAAGGDLQVVAPAEVHYQGITFSPDSNFIYYVAYEKNNVVAALYKIPALGGTPLKVLLDIDSPVAFSTDGKRIAFVRNDPDSLEGSLMVANEDGTEERKLLTRLAPEFFALGGPAWSPDDTRIACAVGRNQFNRTTMHVAEVSLADGASRILTRRQWDFIGQLAWLNDGRSLLMDAWDSSASLLSLQIWELSVADGEARRITNDLNSYHGVSLTADNNALVTIRAGRATNLWVAPGANIDQAVRITSGAGDLVGEVMGLAWTPDDRLVYGSNASGQLNIWTMNADGSQTKQLTYTSQPDVKPVVSPDGRFIVFVSWRTGTSHLWRMNTDGTGVKQLTNGDAETYPDISPDGRWVVYLSASQNRAGLWKIASDGSGEAVKITDANMLLFPAVSPDGKQLACFYVDGPNITRRNIALIPFEGGAPVKLFELPASAFMRAGLRWMAGGRAVTYVDHQNGVSNIWSQPVDGGPPRRLTNFTSDKIFRFAWSRDGGRLAFERGMEINDATLINDFR
jgi:Tol biopolymer transport system component/DNA-binding winged helix-turn-helix (wHTH) protein